jgi:hypothetical protein
MQITRKVRPAFTIKRRENVTRTVVNMRYVKAKGETKGKFVCEEVTEKLPEVFDVYFPQGHSIRVDSRERLAALGLVDNPDLIDMNTGEVIAKSETLDLEHFVARNTRNADPFVDGVTT